MDKYYLKLKRFEGPLDLLLHLIRVHEIDIFDIDIFLLADQYLRHLRLIEFRDLNMAGEFLQMAASLIDIKTRMLLPRPENDGGEDTEDDDPRLPLQERLLEYERMRLAAEQLHGRPQLGVQVRTNAEAQRLEPIYQSIEAPLRGNMTTLVILYEQMLRALADRKPARVEAKTNALGVEEIITRLIALLERVNFTLFQGLYKRLENRYELVVHVLAVLELAKAGRVRLYQQELMGPLWIYRAEYGAEAMRHDHHPDVRRSSAEEISG